MDNYFFNLLMFFLIYSFLGWAMESTFRSVMERKVINSGFLKGPVCPIYGIGAIIMLTLLSKLESNIVLLFFVSLIVLTIWEYIVGVLLEKIFKTKYWDYSNHKLNFQGRVCLTNSIYWGLLGVLFIKFIHPFIQNLVLMVNLMLLKYLVIVFFIVLMVDTITTVIKIKNIKTTLEKVEQLNKEIIEKVKEIKELRNNKEKTISIENIQNLVDNLKDKRDKIAANLYKNVNRLKNAFPAINTKEITEVLNKKIEIKKKNKKH